MLRIDERRALLRVRLRQQTFTWGLNKSRISVIAIAVGVAQLQRLDDRVDVFGAIALH